ncbi:hypothetical protein BL254_19100 [Protofrankia sp. BMG5.30]|uniref:Uncharacterized protein n=1 Tax=Protofrankia coriariae TaxID=1562887 RepID=A0ABR5F2J8_9ACTN|nr:hypothetical protein FrCorBMG51_14920 [Protofrankia coriariae]ONH33905.1 hypothetical protein BL254_19100 [Protofrankia sp. BMG5.30]
MHGAVAVAVAEQDGVWPAEQRMTFRFLWVSRTARYTAVRNRSLSGCWVSSAVAGQVGEEVVLDLVAEVPAQNMEQHGSVDVGRAQ